MEGMGVEGGATAEASRRERIVTRIVRIMIKMRLHYFSKISLRNPVNFSAGLAGKFCQEVATLTSSHNYGLLLRCRHHVLLQGVLVIVD
jgi:hypothetical protein